MKLFVRHAALRLLAALLLILAGAFVAKADGAKKKRAHAGTSPSATASPSAKPRFDVPIPVSHDAEGVKLPYYDVRGRLQMYFSIGKATRVDTDHLELKNAYMQTYDEKGAPDTNVFMKRAALDLNTRVVTSEIPVIVRRSDFVIVGQKMIFNTVNHQGHMTGHVRMIIYNHQGLAQPSPSPGASPAGGASKPKPQ